MCKYALKVSNRSFQKHEACAIFWVSGLAWGELFAVPGGTQLMSLECSPASQRPAQTQPGCRQTSRRGYKSWIWCLGLQQSQRGCTPGFRGKSPLRRPPSTFIPTPRNVRPEFLLWGDCAGPPPGRGWHSLPRAEIQPSRF